MGVLIVAPFLWSVPRWGRLVRGRAEVVEAVAAASVLVGVCMTAFLTDYAFMFAIMPVLGWIAWRFEQPGAAPAALFVSTFAVLAAVDRRGPFATGSLVQRMVTLQTFNATVAFMSLLFVSAVAQRQRRAARERHAVELLQRSLLPDRLPAVAGVAAAARYVPASRDIAVGGDWYALVPLPAGRLAVAVGDVAGHGIAAATVMGQVRMALRTHAWENVNPGMALARLDRMLQEVDPDAMSTAWYARFDPDGGVLTFASAGHLPPLVIEADGAAWYVPELRAPPLGIGPGREYDETMCTLPPGATLLLYTDGLVERRSVPLDDRLRVLRDVASGAPADIEAFCDHLISTLVEQPSHDDVAVLAVRLSNVDSPAVVGMDLS